MMDEQHYDPTKAAKAQETYCEGRRIPMFAPRNGWCFRCGRNIYEAYTVRHGTEPVVFGISVEKAGRKLITGCPHCNASFVE